MQFKFSTFLLLLFVIYSCDNPVDQNTSKLQISFKNNSAYQLNNFMVSKKLIGNLSGNSSSGYIDFENFGFDSGLPDEDASAEVNG